MQQPQALSARACDRECQQQQQAAAAAVNSSNLQQQQASLSAEVAAAKSVRLVGEFGPQKLGYRGRRTDTAGVSARAWLLHEE